jgi:hypothetical protein
MYKFTSEDYASEYIYTANGIMHVPADGVVITGNPVAMEALERYGFTKEEYKEPAGRRGGGSVRPVPPAPKPAVLSAGTGREAEEVVETPKKDK